MPVFETINFGTISFSLESVFLFPVGLPGFESKHHFVPVQNPRTFPIVFLQSLEDPALCFTTIPVRVVCPGYQLQMLDEDLAVMGWQHSQPPRIGEEVLCLAVLSIRESGPTANLLAPLVVNLKTHRAVQAVADNCGYSHQHALFPVEAPVCS